MARSTIFFATAKRTSGSSEMPVSSLEMATTAALVLLDQRQDGLEPLLLAGDRVDQRPALGDLEPGLRARRRPRSRSRAAGPQALHDLDRLDEERRLVGQAVTPALTSSSSAPAATCSSASFFTVSKLPATISAASFLRPVGLMRSPITQNGWSKPITTSLVAEVITVSVMMPISLRRPPRRPAGQDAGLRDDLGDQLLLPVGHDVHAGDALDLADLLDESRCRAACLRASGSSPPPAAVTMRRGYGCPARSRASSAPSWPRRAARRRPG